MKKGEEIKDWISIILVPIVLAVLFYLAYTL